MLATIVLIFLCVAFIYSIVQGKADAIRTIIFNFVLGFSVVMTLAYIFITEYTQFVYDLWSR